MRFVDKTEKDNVAKRHMKFSIKCRKIKTQAYKKDKTGTHDESDTLK